MWLQAGIYKNMLSVSVLTMEINGSVETSGLIQLLKCWCRWKYFRSTRHVAGTYNTGGNPCPFELAGCQTGHPPRTQTVPDICVTLVSSQYSQ